MGRSCAALDLGPGEERLLRVRDEQRHVKWGFAPVYVPQRLVRANIAPVTNVVVRKGVIWQTGTNPYGRGAAHVQSGQACQYISKSPTVAQG